MKRDDNLDAAAAGIMSDEYQIWIKDNSLKRIQKYLQSGRAYAKLSADQAIAQWVASLQLYAEDPQNLEHYQDYLDIESELALRKIDPPLLDVLQAFGKLATYIEQQSKELNKNPEKWERRGDAMGADFMECLLVIEEGKNKR